MYVANTKDQLKPGGKRLEYFKILIKYQPYCIRIKLKIEWDKVDIKLSIKKYSSIFPPDPS